MSRPFVLVSEARGEFLVVEQIRKHMHELGRSTVHVTVREGDVSGDELKASGAIVLESHPAYRQAEWADDAVAAVADEEQRLDVNLRRVWKADLRSWREGADDDEMARLALGYLAAWRSILEETGPVAGLWGEDGGHLAKRSGFLIGAAREIPLWFVYVAPLPERLLAIDNPLNRFSRSDLEATQPREEEEAYARDFLDALRSSRVQFATPLDLTFRPGRVTRFVSLLLDRYVRRPPGADQLYPFTFARLYARQRATRAALRSLYGSVPDGRFVFHPIHAGFDAQISIRAPQWENQLALIEHVASSLPYGYELAIKEHPFEVGALPLAPLRRLLARHPEIHLLDPAIHAHTVLRSCAAVTTVNSTTGYEALFFGRPVVTFGHSPYRGLGLTWDVESPFETPDLLARALRPGAVPEEEIMRLVTFLYRNSFPGVSLAYDVGEENARRHAELFAELARRGDS